MKPTVKIAASPLVLPVAPVQFHDLKPNFLSLIRANQFSGEPHDTTECPLKHLQLYIDLCDTMSANEQAVEYIRMKAFKFSLTGKAAQWFDKLAPKSITSWKELAEVFTDKYFPAYKTKEGRKRIYDFEQGHTESLENTWERYKGLIHACPTHGLPMFQLISIFFDGMNERSRTRMNDY